MMDRREGSRAPFTVQVNLTRLLTYERFETQSVNISDGGMLLRSPKKFEIGDALRFDAPGFAGECRVMWVSEFPGNILVGVHFTSVGAEARRQLVEMLREQDETVLEAP